MASLRDELAFVEGYLEIERARFGDRLCVTREVAPETLDVPVPSLLLQPLVENAVLHGQDSEGRIDLLIRITLEVDEVLIAIADQGPGMPAGYGRDAGGGVGLRNVRERLRKAYSVDRGLEIVANEPQGTIVVIGIPMREAT
jgi:two-component system LytT family sensor kinase